MPRKGVIICTLCPPDPCKQEGNQANGSKALTRLIVQDQPFVALLLLLPWGARDLRPEDRHFEGGGMRFCFQHCSLVFSSSPSLAMMLLLRSLNHWNPTFFSHLCIYLRKVCLIGPVSEHVTERVCRTECQWSPKLSFRSWFGFISLKPSTRDKALAGQSVLRRCRERSLDTSCHSLRNSKPVPFRICV